MDETKPIVNGGAAIRSITRRYYAVRLFDSLGPSFIFGIYPLFMRSRGLNQFEMNCVAATYFTMTFLTDVPTGAFADAIGRRMSYVIGSLLSVAAFVLYFFSFHYWNFLVAETIDAIGGTFRNGAVDAWAVDALDAEDFQGSKDGIFSRVSQLFRLGGMAGALAGAYAARIDISIPWMMGALGQILMAAVAGLVMYGERPHSRGVNAGEIARRVRERMAAGMREGFGRRAVLMLAVANGVTIAAWSPYWFEWPQFFDSGFNTGPQVVGWIFCLFGAAGMLGSEVVARRAPAVSRRASYLGVGVILQSMCMLGAAAFTRSTWAVMGLFFAANLAAGMLAPVYMSWFNDEIDEAHRATMLSFGNTFNTMGAAMGLPVGGVIADRFGLATAWGFGGVLASIAGPFYLSLRPASTAAGPEEDSERLRALR